jgi:hypothetical protein
LNKEQHIRMLNQLMEGTQSFVATLTNDEDWMTNLQVSAGFHYPVRPQYSTLHLQLRVNSGSVCREDARGIEVSTLVRQLQMDTKCYARDDRVLTFQVTENVKVSLLAAAKRHQEEEYPKARMQGDDGDHSFTTSSHAADDAPQVWKQIGFDTFELGRCFGKEMETTIEEEEGEDEEGRLAEEEAKVKEKAEQEARSKMFMPPDRSPIAPPATPGGLAGGPFAAEGNVVQFAEPSAVPFAGLPVTQEDSTPLSQAAERDDPSDPR